jgi:hypothetical protein
MVMMLPFLLGTIAVWYGIRGKRDLCFALWILTLVVFAIWCNYHMTAALTLSL